MISERKLSAPTILVSHIERATLYQPDNKQISKILNFKIDAHFYSYNPTTFWSSRRNEYTYREWWFYKVSRPTQVPCSGFFVFYEDYLKCYKLK